MAARIRRLATLLVLFALFSFALLGGFLWYRMGKRPASADRNAPKVRVTVPAGVSAASLGDDLEAKGVIQSAALWRLLYARNAVIKPGVYDLSPAETPPEILRRLVKGDVATVKVTFPEGFTLVKMAERLKSNGLIADENPFLDLTARQGNTLKGSAFPPPVNLEGYLFPDTYLFPVGADEKAIAQRMLDNFDKRVAEGLAGEIKTSGRSLHEILTVAAMVEREAETDADRPKIAGVIYNRLAKGMRLQIDATVQYARGQHKSRLLYSVLDVESAYNTYKVSGLPPGPICNPGLPSIEAALKPERHDFLFYVAGPDGKSHLFSRTLAEHNRNIAFARRGGAR